MNEASFGLSVLLVRSKSGLPRMLSFMVTLELSHYLSNRRLHRYLPGLHLCPPRATMSFRRPSKLCGILSRPIRKESYHLNSTATLISPRCRLARTLNFMLISSTRQLFQRRLLLCEMVALIPEKRCKIRLHSTAQITTRIRALKFISTCSTYQEQCRNTHLRSSSD